MRQLALPIGVEPAPTFASFIAGANGAALAALRAPGKAPVYLWGPAGAGKSHLLRAACAAVAQGGEHAAWFDAATPVPWSIEGAVLAAIDDCDALDAARQHAAFALFVEAAQGGVPVVAAGRVPPVDLPLREDLRTRLGWGLVFGVEPLSEAGTRAALRREADRRGLVLGDDVLDFLLTRCPRDLKFLSERLEALDAYALRARRAPTLPLLRRMLADDNA